MQHKSETSEEFLSRLPGNDGIHPVKLSNGHPSFGMDYEIVNEPIDDARWMIPPGFAERYEALHDALFTDPGSAIAELKQAVETYPDLPVLKNWLQQAYSATRQFEKADALTERLYRDHPDYLFARIGMAAKYLERRDFAKFREVIPFFDLKLIYPDRDRFHLSEAIALLTVSGMYFAEMGEKPAAKMYLSQLIQLAPEHPATLQLANKMALFGMLKPPPSIPRLKRAGSFAKPKRGNQKKR